MKAFLLYESKNVSGELGDEGIKGFVAGVVLAPSIEEAARLLGGELELFEDEKGEESETIVWLPAVQLNEVWDDNEYDRRSLDLTEKKDEMPGKHFSEYVWIHPKWGRIPLGDIDMIGTENRRGLAIHEISLFS